MKRSHTTTQLLVLVAALVICCVTISSHAQTRWYVDASASSNGDGTDWPNAFDNLDDALAEAEAGDDIWVAQGTYRPSVGSGRAKTFTLVNGVKTYGGFSGNETHLHERNPDLYPTILSGAIGSTPPDGVYHVVTGSNLNDSTYFSGFTITGGYADGTGINQHGAGILLIESHAIIKRCKFHNNVATQQGGGLAVLEGHAKVFNCIFENNEAARGGGIYWEGDASGSEMTIVNCLFNGNNAGAGGGLASSDAGGRIVNCTFVNNDGSTHGGGIFISGVHTEFITNCIFWGNKGGEGTTEFQQIFPYQGPSQPVVTYSAIEGCDDFCEESEDANIGDDPLFCAGFRLGEGSPCIDAGDTASVIWEDDLDIGVDVDDDGFLIEPVPDLDLNNRIVDVGSGFIVDMGAFERGPCPEADINNDCIVDQDDLDIVMNNWGNCPSPCPPYCEGDLDESCGDVWATC